MTFTYPEVGATREQLPEEYHHVRLEKVLGVGDDVFARAVERLMSWEMHRGAGMTAAADTPRAAEGSEVLLRWLGQRIPCRVVYVIDEVDRKGFAYGTLEGHPERGEELFLIERDPHTGEVGAFITAFSKPDAIRTKLLGPVGRMVQRWMTRRYLDALVSSG